MLEKQAFTKIRHIFAPYDSGARYGGVSGGCFSWKTIVPCFDTFLPREHGSSLPVMLSSKVGHCLSEGAVPFVFGGDHSLTFHSYKAVYERFGPLEIVVFDAHHDSYPDNALSHYSVFHHIKRLFNAPIHWTGVRKDKNDVDENLIHENFEFLDPESKVYLSIDMDYFSPDMLPSVMDPVDDDGYHTLDRFTKTLDTLKARIVGADIVEWQGADMVSPEYTHAQSVYHNIVEHVTAHAQS